MGIKDIIKIKEVDSDDIEFLYEMLKERDSRINVTHNELPSFNQHKKFFETNPYDGWYIIMAENKNGNKVSSGIYFIRHISNDYSETEKIIILY